MTLESGKGERFRFPTPEELLAIERAARLARARGIARPMVAAGRQLKELMRRADAAPRTESQFSTQFPTERKTMTASSLTTSFWKDALASLPPIAQRRYATAFEAAERFETLLDTGIAAWGSARRALARTFQTTAHAMRRTARILDSAARRLFPVH
jgi:hypothetical protein